MHFKFPLDSRVFCCLQKAKVRHPFEGCGCRDGAIAPASESTVTPLHHLAGARAAVDEWHHRTNSPNVFAAVACAASSAHPDGVAVQCLACSTFNGKDKAGEPRLYKFGPFGGNRANCKYDVGHFVSRRLRSTKHQQNWAAFFERTMRVLPRGEALPSARPAAPLPLTHLDVMRHTHAKDFEITSSTWLCRRCGHQGTLNASTTPGSLLSHLSSARRNRLQPVRLAASRCAQFFVVSDSVKRRRAVELRFPRSHQAARWHAQAEGLQPLQVAVVNRYGRTTTKDVAPAAPAKRPPTAASTGPPGKAPGVERTPASSKAAQPWLPSRACAGSRLGGRRGRSRFAASVCSGTTPCSRKQEATGAIHCRRRMGHPLCCECARRRRQRRPVQWAAGCVGGHPWLQRGGHLAWWQADRWD